MRQVTIAEYETFFTLKNGSDTLATSPIREPLDALAHAYNNAEAMAEALRDLLKLVNHNDPVWNKAFDVLGNWEGAKHE